LERADGPAELRGSTFAERAELREWGSLWVRPNAVPVRTGVERSDKQIAPPDGASSSRFFADILG
jgi:hypothetical protein